MAPKVYWFENNRGVEIDHVTALRTPGYHTCNFTVRDRIGNCTVYAVEVESDLIGSLHPRDLAKYLFNLVDNGQSATVVKRFKEAPFL